MFRSVPCLALLSLLAGCSCESPPGPDGGADGGFDGGRDGGGDAPALDVLADATTPDAPADAPSACTVPGYPVSVAASGAERTAVAAAQRAFETATGSTVTLDDTTLAVTGVTGGAVPLTLDGSIADPCARAEAALRAFFVAEDALFRMPGDMTVRACSYDALTDAEIVRMHGGTYGGRRLLGLDNDIVAHVTRSGTLRFYAGGYLPDGDFGLPNDPCLDGEGVRGSLLDERLEYTRFSLCVPGASGSIVITGSDLRVLGDAGLFVDASSRIHLVRSVDVLLDPARVTSEQINSDLFCCPGASLEGCVGKTLIVDEIDGAVLAQIPRCHTC